ncbi:gliding motility-associated ABC transporter ATP-binding subunit GldA [Companilactobacillus crustorum]|uniref:Gliding motility protein GldA n=3 Tax=Companilactobacillus TaxID=2767879 RepID=A0A837RK11_9LACO|nr:ATP-binding cassette domain-containing protein [Companilactobacillus crustorum]KRK44518.1 gliding motility protein GldA [Companilactobacillus crustorum JCM 15951]KRO21830.1 gliding motility protein GldA [Companilactobacillus crustorum]GEO76006.1 gliding motility-associated ABC transporter ATP-binding subunit GldA [Companilactobacillus crustorum]
MKLISVNDLSLQNEGYFAFKHVAFSISQNEIISISGDNGSGKTQLLEILTDNRMADGGTIEYTPGVRIGYLPQNDPQIIEATVGKYLENIRLLSKKLAVRKDQLKEMITFMGLSPYLDRSVQQLSWGIRRRVGFLAAVAGHPNVLLLDEPFAFQSSSIIKNMLTLIQDLKENGSGIILAGTEFDERINQCIDKSFLLKDNNLSLASSIEEEPNQEVALIFRVNPNSIAITPDLEKYIVSNINNLIEMKIPVALRNTIVKRMVQLNYQFEGDKEIES